MNYPHACRCDTCLVDPESSGCFHEASTRRYRKALDRIVQRGCSHCSAFETAAQACGMTYSSSSDREDGYEKLLRDARALRRHVYDTSDPDKDFGGVEEKILTDTAWLEDV